MAKSRRESQRGRLPNEPDCGQAAHEMVARRAAGPSATRAAPRFCVGPAMAFGLHRCNRAARIDPREIRSMQRGVPIMTLHGFGGPSRE